MVDYHDHYLKKDVLLLTCVFEKFIKTCLEFYGLDPSHYISSPGVSLDVMLRKTGIELEKISGIDKYYFIEKGLRGRTSYIAKRYAKAYNKYMYDYYPKKPTTFITYLDKNNLYGWTMCEYLPYARFEWVKNINEFNINSIYEKSDTGYFLEGDLKYPDELHELHNDYPLASEKNCYSR